MPPLLTDAPFSLPPRAGEASEGSHGILRRGMAQAVRYRRRSCAMEGLLLNC